MSFISFYHYATHTPKTTTFKQFNIFFSLVCFSTVRLIHFSHSPPFSRALLSLMCVEWAALFCGAGIWWLLLFIDFQPVLFFLKLWTWNSALNSFLLLLLLSSFLPLLLLLFVMQNKTREFLSMQNRIEHVYISFSSLWSDSMFKMKQKPKKEKSM